MVNKKNIQRIVFGSPGTGKSHEIDNVIIPNELNIDTILNPGNVIKTVFHPEYTSHDFIGKLIPITQQENFKFNFYVSVSLFLTQDFFGSIPKIVKNLATVRLLRKPQPSCFTF